jgi:DNA invertase Pin-like site-specific DNA recombinase
VEELGDRCVIEAFKEEAVSAFSGNRGAALEDAMRVAASLAADHGAAELWVQHSDRLARGDGKNARHAVEIALWALKANVQIRPVQDPDTFRDLLYAVVTGQRNHEDSKRRGAASVAGKRRAAERGEYAGSIIDGYRVAVDVDDRGHVTKRMDIDPARKPVIELIFKLASKRHPPSAIARALNARGWKTKPPGRRQKPQPFTTERVIQALDNPRYAGLSPWRGEILATAKWPAYITPEAFAKLHERPLRARRRKYLTSEPFLLRRLMVCAGCGSGIISCTQQLRDDGTRARNYACNLSLHGLCAARRVDAAIVEHALIAHLERFIDEPGTAVSAVAGEPDLVEPESLGVPVALYADHLKTRIRAAVGAGDDAEADRLLDALVEYQQHANAPRPGMPAPGRDAVAALPGYKLALLRSFLDWGADVFAGRSLDHTEARRLNAILRRLFCRIELDATGDYIRLTPETYADARRDIPPGSPELHATPIVVHIPTWKAAALKAGDRHRRHLRWSDPEIIQALQHWTRLNGRSPYSTDWHEATSEHPHAQSVFKHFGSWHSALAAANLQPAPRCSARYQLHDPRDGRFVSARLDTSQT